MAAVSDDGGHYQVERSTAPKANKEPEIKDDPDTRLLREIRDCGTIDNPIHTSYPQQDNVSPDPLQRAREEQTISYTEPAKCKYCNRDEVVYLKSERRYSPKKDTEISNIAPYPYNWPIWLGIDALNTKRDRWGNYKEEFTGKIVPHICKVESLGQDDLRSFVREMVYEKLIDLDKWVKNEIKDIRETAMFKPVVWERKGNW